VNTLTKINSLSPQQHSTTFNFITARCYAERSYATVKAH